jgi:hypothetical protein
MARRIKTLRLSLLAAATAAALTAIAVPQPARAEDHTRIVPREGFRHHERFEHRDFHRGPSVGLFFGAPGVVVPPPPAYYEPYPSYAYAPVPVSGVYLSAYGYCRDYRTNVGIQTACQGADGVWRFIN